MKTKLLKPTTQSGLLLNARYAFMPNKLNYCGGSQNQDLFVYGYDRDIDLGLQEILREFQTLDPYLHLIARANQIRDAYDIKVAQAYWLGNELLDKVSASHFYWHLIDSLQMKKRSKHIEFNETMRKLNQSLPHHSFHVFNIWKRTGHVAIMHTLDTMEQCRISWGKIVKVNESELIVSSPALKLENNKLVLTEPQIKKINHKFFGQSFLVNPKIGQQVTIHWNWACDIVGEEQVNNLEKYTRLSMKIFNM